jgi:hypothetical protein
MERKTGLRQPEICSLGPAFRIIEHKGRCIGEVERTGDLNEMNTVIIVAIVALVSTIVGATIGAATNYVLAVRRERVDRERDTLNHAIEVTRAARLIHAELARARAASFICVEKRHWWSGDVVPLSTEVWQKYSATIAPELTFQAWTAVVKAIEAVDNIRMARNIFVEAGLEANAISDATAEKLAPMLRDITLGSDALAPFGSRLPGFDKRS